MIRSLSKNISTFYKFPLYCNKYLININLANLYFNPTNVYNKILQKNYSATSSINYSKNLANDPVVQEILKEIYKDFSISKDIRNEKKEEENILNKNLYDVTIENEAINSEFNPDIIYDYDEEIMLKKKGLWHDIKKKKKVKLDQIRTFERGKTGVFDLEELVELLREQKAKDVVAIKVPEEYKFVNYLVIATGSSNRHINILGEYIKKVYKLKRHKTDPFIIVEGKGSDWLAFDMKNIALHILSEEIREEKDIEMLWTVGVEYDEFSQGIKRPIITKAGLLPSDQKQQKYIEISPSS